MIPSLVAEELRDALVEFLTTTYSLADEDAADALSEFLLDPDEGIFRGPYVRLRRPFAPAPDDWESPLDWVPDFLTSPHQHQLTAWERLAGRGRIPDPTLVTTGTGSGKTEAFLVPIIDHCIWARQQDQSGIKAVLLYPMNALIEDQQRRIARLLVDLDVSVRGGVFIGDDRSTTGRSVQSEEGLVTNRKALLDDPPDILLTNYKMLDRLLTSPDYTDLWAANRRPEGAGTWEQPLRYVVLDEFHTYDGAQGTDVAMLLRRLGRRLRINVPGRALDGVAPVGTSATLGSGAAAEQRMVDFAGRIFGVPFTQDAVVRESRLPMSRIVASDHELPAPGPGELTAVAPGDVAALSRLLLIRAGEDAAALPVEDPLWIGERLRGHFLTEAVLLESERPTPWSEAVANIAKRDREWHRAHARDPGRVAIAVAQFLTLVSRARRQEPGGRTVPLFPVEMQTWIREVSRLYRRVAAQPSFRWADGPPPGPHETVLPAVFCRECGRSGWMGRINRAAMPTAVMERLAADDPRDVYRAAVEDRASTRVMIRASGREPDVAWLDPVDLATHLQPGDGDDRVPVLISGFSHQGSDENTRDRAARNEECPSCRARDAIRFLGSRVTTLAAVSITQLFGSDHVADDQRKLLAFTDSVQDASHRAAFFSARAHRFNQRAIVASALAERPLTIDEATDRVMARAEQDDRPADVYFSITPPDIVGEPAVQATWSAEHPPAASVRALRERVAFEVALEVGLRSRFGRTVETSGAAAAHVAVPDEDWSELVQHATEALQHEVAQLDFGDDPDVHHWLRGLLERMRLRGAILHPWLEGFLASGGRRWLIWGGRPDLMPAFPSGISAPTFPVSSSLGDKRDLDPIGGPQTWYVDWTQRLLRVGPAEAATMNRVAMDLLADAGVVVRRRPEAGGVVWALPPGRIELVAIGDGPDGRPRPSHLRCSVCATRHYVPTEAVATWEGRACLRYRCPGTYEPVAFSGDNYYRRLYQEGRIRRVVAAEHTGLLTDQQRREVEHGFRDSPSPDAPNVLTATPTLEMGIDIGDLSAVMLTSVPRTQSSYVQRVGRAGRATGNAFITTFAASDPMSLYRLSDPVAMMAGDIPAPACYLDAREILRRQYTAYHVDRAAEDRAAYGVLPRRIDQVVDSRHADDGWIPSLLAHGSDSDAVADFLSLFGDDVSASVADGLRKWATDAQNDGRSMAGDVSAILGRWDEERAELDRRRNRIQEAVKRLQERGGLTTEDKEQLDRLHGEMRALVGRLKEMRGEPSLSALERLGLLPNYTLVDDTARLVVTLFHPAEEDSSRREPIVAQYDRSAGQAVREFAPGNTFYVDAHQVRIDAVDIGPESEPSHAFRRLCAACGYATEPEPNPSSVGSCPRCGDTGIADHGAIVRTLPIRRTFADEAESRARTSDDSDERRQRHFVTVDTVDVDPTQVTAAWLHTGAHTVFGVEAAREVVVRTVNLGTGGPDTFVVGGHQVNAGLFKVCGKCGGAYGVHGDADDPDDRRHHRGWCKVRSGAVKAEWLDLAITHELRTEAVRILLPVADFEVSERILSFEAALMVGLRESYGGDPDHLQVRQSQHPSPDGGANQFVVVHDRVPGGTGYLHRLAEPDRLREILTDARRVISTCPCQQENQPGCHRCLYGNVRSRHLPFISRRAALDILDEILTDWGMEEAEDGTITGVNLEPVRQSELERLFKSVLHRWAQSASGVSLGSKPDPSAPQQRVFDLRFSGGPRWRITEQHDALAQHNTIPDFWAVRTDVTGHSPVAVFLDGWAYHGCDPDKVASDADKRASLRSDGVRVWSMTYDDVDRFRKILDGQPHASEPALLSTSQRPRAEAVLAQLANGEAASQAALSLSAVDGLLDHLRRPESWGDVSMAVAMGLGAEATPVSVASSHAAVTSFLLGADLPEDLASTWRALPGYGPFGVRTLTTVGPHHAVGVTVLYDTTDHDADDEAERERWTNWLHLGNVVQFLDPGPVVVTATGSLDIPMTGPVLAADDDGAYDDGLSAESEETLDDLLDDDVRDLVWAVLTAGGGDGVVAGWELADGSLVEAAWPDAKVGVVAPDFPIPSAPGWDLRHVDDWTPDELVAALKKADA